MEIQQRNGLLKLIWGKINKKPKVMPGFDLGSSLSASSILGSSSKGIKMWTLEFPCHGKDPP